MFLASVCLALFWALEWLSLSLASCCGQKEGRGRRRKMCLRNDNVILFERRGGGGDLKKWRIFSGCL